MATTEIEVTEGDGFEELALDAISTLVEDADREASESIGTLVERLRQGERPTESDVRALRQATEGLTLVTEEYVAAACEATESRSERWGGDGR
jgi:hypothetical protein